MTSITEDTARGEYVAGLRAIADLLDQHPELELPDTGRGENHEFSLCAGDREQMVAWARVLDAPTEKPSISGNGIHYLRGLVGCLRFRVFASAERLGASERTVTKRVTEYSVPPLLAEATR